MQKSYPDAYQVVDFPTGNPPSGTAWLWRSPSGWAEKRSDGSIHPLSLQVESARAPTIADLDKPWTEWWFYSYDFPNLKATVSVWKRSPVSNDLFPPLNPIGQVDIALPTPIDLPNGNKQVEMPQGAVFEYQVTRNAASNSVTFPAGTFSAINSYYLDAAKVVLNVGVRAQTVTPTQTAMGLGIIVAAPANAAFVRYEFQYVLGGVLRYDFAI